MSYDSYRQTDSGRYSGDSITARLKSQPRYH
jgi:hypothetical protein